MSGLLTLTLTRPSSNPNLSSSSETIALKVTVCVSENNEYFFKFLSDMLLVCMCVYICMYVCVCMYDTVYMNVLILYHYDKYV